LQNQCDAEEPEQSSSGPVALNTETEDDHMDDQMEMESHMTADQLLKVVAQQRQELKKRRLKTVCLQKKIDRLQCPNSKLPEAVQERKELNEKCLPPLIQDILDHGSNVRLPIENESLKEFCVALHYLSPKAYGFVRKSFQNSLPHSRTIQNWVNHINCKPGSHFHLIPTN